MLVRVIAAALVMNSLITEYGRHRQFQPQVRPSIRLKSQNDRLVTQPTSAAEDLDWSESGQPGPRLLGLCDADHHQPASG